MTIKLSNNRQVQDDFRPSSKGVVVYNPSMDLIGLLINNSSLPEGFILINHNVEEYVSFSDAIVWNFTMTKEWEYVCDL